MAALLSVVVGQLQSGSSWPMLGQNANHTGGSSAFLGPISTPTLSWAVSLINAQESTLAFGLYSPVTAVINNVNYVFAITSRTPATIYGYSNADGAVVVKVVHATYGVGWGDGGSSPAIGSVYGYFGDSNGNLCRFPLATGTQIETCMGANYATGLLGGNPLRLPNGYAVSSPAVLLNGVVCVTTTFGSLHCAGPDLTRVGNLPYGFYFVSQTNSPLFPTFDTGSAAATIYAPPTLLLFGLGGYAYFGTGTSATIGYVFCVDINHMGDVNKAVVWTVQVPDGSGAVTSPVAGSNGYLYVLSARGYAYQINALTGILVSSYGGVNRQLCGSGYLSSLTPAPILFSQSGNERLAVSCATTGQVSFVKFDGTTFDSFSPGTGTCYLSAAGSYTFPINGGAATDTYIFSACSNGILYGLSTLYSSSTGSGGGLDSIATTVTTGATLATYPTLLGDGSLVVTSTNGWIVSYVGQVSVSASSTMSPVGTTSGSISPISSITMSLSATGSNSPNFSPSVSASASLRSSLSLTSTLTMSRSLSPTPVATLVYVVVAVVGPATTAAPSSINDAGVAMVIIGVIMCLAAGTMVLYWNPALSVHISNAMKGGPPPAKRGGGSLSLSTSRGGGVGMPPGRPSPSPSVSSSSRGGGVGMPPGRPSPSPSVSSSSYGLVVRPASPTLGGSDSVVVSSAGRDPSPYLSTPKQQQQLSNNGSARSSSLRGNAMMIRNEDTASPGNSSIISRSSPPLSLSSSVDRGGIPPLRGGDGEMSISPSSVSPRRRARDFEDNHTSVASSALPPNFAALSPPEPPPRSSPLPPHSSAGNPFAIATHRGGAKAMGGSRRSLSPRTSTRAQEQGVNDGIYGGAEM